MNSMDDLLRRHLADWRSGWSMGSFGAIAEFHQDEGEPAVIDDAFELARATRRGAIRISRNRLADIVPVAYETLSPKRHRWSQALALCLPDAAARRAQRSVLAEIGPDDAAIRAVDRTGILFDMGLGLPQCDFCIRTSDPRLLAELRAHLGRSPFEPGNGAMAAILKAHPHRVALTNIGRVEVYQKIGGPDTGGVSPPGPHTHLLPKLLMSGRTHSANAPIPEGLVPLGHLHPGNPVVGPMGEERPFDGGLFDAFHALFQTYGPHELVAAKAAVLAAIEEGRDPARMPAPQGRFERSAMRLAIRQQKVLAAAAGDEARLKRLAIWAETLDPASPSDSEDDDAPGH